MNKKFWKVAVFSFLIIFILTYWLGDRTIMTTDMGGLTSPSTLSNFDYSLKTAGYSLVGTGIILLVFYLIKLAQKK